MSIAPLPLIRTLRVSCAALVLGALGACDRSPTAVPQQATATPSPSPGRSPASTAPVPPSSAELPGRRPDSLPIVSETPLVWTGIVEHMDWTKTDESWDAGGSAYYVLVRDDVRPQNGRAGREILRCSPAFPKLDDFEPFTGRRVELRGRRAGYVRWRPDAVEQYPTTREPGVASAGGGVVVDAIRLLDGTPTPAGK